MEILTILNDVRSGKSIYAFPPISGWGIVYKTLAEKIKTHRFHAFDFYDSDNFIETYAKHIEMDNSNNDIILLGYSAGGSVAFEVAKYLDGIGINIDKLILIDAPPETAIKTRTNEDINKYSEKFYNFLKTIGFIEVLDNRYKFDTHENLKQEVVNRISSYNRYLDNLVSTGKIKCDIFMIKSTDTDYIKPDDIMNWKKMTKKNVSVFNGDGDHLSMLEKKSLANNFSIIKKILESGGMSYQNQS
jgi:thioesterase domain-containing protein